jgi:hypothetical protein
MPRGDGARNPDPRERHPHRFRALVPGSNRARASQDAYAPLGPFAVGQDVVSAIAQAGGPQRGPVGGKLHENYILLLNRHLRTLDEP